MLLMRMGLLLAALLGTSVFVAGCDAKGESGGSDENEVSSPPPVWIDEASDHFRLYEYKLGPNGERINHGKCIFKDKEERVLAEGRYLEGKESGIWRAWYPNSQICFEGEYLDGLKNGEWIYWDKEGNVTRREIWDAGRMRLPERADGATPAIDGATTLPTSNPSADRMKGDEALQATSGPAMSQPTKEPAPTFGR